MKKVALIKILKEKAFIDTLNESEIIETCDLEDVRDKYDLTDNWIFFHYGFAEINDFYVILIDHYNNKLFSEFLINLQKFECRKERKEKLQKLTC
jgi:hypothetical protein